MRIRPLPVVLPLAATVLIAACSADPVRPEAATPSLARTAAPVKMRFTVPVDATMDGGPGTACGLAADVHLTGELTIGRAAGCQITLDDSYVSQLHARVFVREGVPYVEDLGSTNGTYLNTRKVSSAIPMRHGDKLKIGSTVMEVAG